MYYQRSPYPAAFVSPVVVGTQHKNAAAAISPLAVMESIPPSSLSSAELVGTSLASTVDVGSARAFEAVAPDPSLLVGMGSVVLLCIAAGFVWANDVVPVSRTKLAISKSRGDVKEYLDGLKTMDENSSPDINATALQHDEQNDVDEIVETYVKPNVGDGRDFERWLFSDWLNKPGAKGGRQKEPALPILKEAKWNSGDNPVLVTAAIMMLGVVLASITERITT